MFLEMECLVSYLSRIIGMCVEGCQMNESTSRAAQVTEYRLQAPAATLIDHALYSFTSLGFRAFFVTATGVAVPYSRARTLLAASILLVLSDAFVVRHVGRGQDKPALAARTNGAFSVL